MVREDDWIMRQATLTDKSAGRATLSGSATSGGYSSAVIKRLVR